LSSPDEVALMASVVNASRERRLRRERMAVDNGSSLPFGADANPARQAAGPVGAGRVVGDWELPV
jgi:hypothetical protein